MQLHNKDWTRDNAVAKADVRSKSRENMKDRERVDITFIFNQGMPAYAA